MLSSEQKSFIQRVSIIVHSFGFAQEVADFIGCQFALESNFGKSDLAVNYCNYCGMKFPLVRISLANRISSNNVFAKYNGFIQCIHDYMLCLNYHQPSSKVKESIQSFSFFIKNWYCPEKDYISKIQSIYSQFSPYHSQLIS